MLRSSTRGPVVSSALAAAAAVPSSARAGNARSTRETTTGAIKPSRLTTSSLSSSSPSSYLNSISSVSAPCASSSRRRRSFLLSGSSIARKRMTSLSSPIDAAVVSIVAASAAAPSPSSMPTSSSTIPSSPSGNDLLIVGPGVLGSYLGLLWKRRHPEANVVGQTNTTASHDKLRALGIAPRTNDDVRKEDDSNNASANAKYPRVVFAAPPSGSADFVADIKAALSLWDSAAPGACFVYTGSAAVYDVDDGSQCNEDSPLVPRGAGERTDRLLDAEDAVLGAGGCVLRLAGLYHAHRGAHTFFLRMGKVDRWGGYTVNLLHYEDAARLAEAVLAGNGAGEPGPAPSPSPPSWRSKAFLGTDGAPVTFQDMCDAAVASGVYRTSSPVEFTAPPPGGGGGSSASRGKLMSNAATREALAGTWEPRYSSFESFVASGAVDVYATDPRLGGGVGAAHAG